jgi:hypothetical protein
MTAQPSRPGAAHAAPAGLTAAQAAPPRLSAAQAAPAGLGSAEALRVKLGQAAPAVQAATARLWQQAGLRPRYAEYLRVMHGVIRASVPLMERAAQLCVARGPADPAAGPVREYLEAHIREERGHDDWLLADLAALGAEPAETLAAQPPPAVARLVGPQYYWIEHYHPVALLGYIAVMEANAPAPWLAGWIQAAAGVPQAAVRTVREHAALDPGHAGQVLALVDSCPLTQAQERAIAVSGLATVHALVDLLDGLAGGHGSPVPAAPRRRTP